MSYKLLDSLKVVTIFLLTFVFQEKSMSLVKAQCPNCNGFLEVDNSKDAAVCPFCNTPYIVEKAIQNITNNINNRYYINNATFSNKETEESYIERGVTFINLNELEKAQEVFKDFSDKYPANYKSWLGLCVVEYKLYHGIDSRIIENATNTAPEEEKNMISDLTLFSEDDENELISNEMQDALDTKQKALDGIEYAIEKSKKNIMLFGILTGVALVIIVIMLINAKRSVDGVGLASLLGVPIIILVVNIFLNIRKIPDLKFEQYRVINSIEEINNGNYEHSLSLDNQINELRREKQIGYFIKLLSK